MTTDEHLNKVNLDDDEFCRGCGRCMPCPAGIKISDCARMNLFLRSDSRNEYLSDEWKAKMKRIEFCLHCNLCKSRCPYELDTPNLLKRNYEEFKTFI
ncbi:MAG: 4Fe-4S dicluster domain-containing protein [Bacteroidales bacterium]|nr:4Fe-4S dicluster domain-containing protein [Bacteroidales bacterium]